jgi:hypothetical protein
VLVFGTQEEETMKVKTLTGQEVKRRITKTISEVVSNLFNMSNETATKELRTAFGEVMQSDRSLFQAAFIYQLNRLIQAGIKGKGKRCTEHELEAVLMQIRASAPEMASALRKELKEMQGRLPRRGGPGRDEILNTTEKREACEQIGSLHKMGMIKRWSDIFENVAAAFRSRGKEVSARTIKRVWEDREALYVG